MATAKEYPLALVVRAVDKATGPLRKISATIKTLGDSVRPVGNAFKALYEESGLKKLGKPFGEFSSAMSDIGGKAKALALTFVGLGAVAGLTMFSIIKSTIDAGDKLAEMSDRVGLSVDAYASLSHAAAQADIDQESFNGAMDQFNKRLGEAKSNGGPLLEFLKKVSPALGQQVKAAKGTEAALSLMTDAMAKIEDPGKRAAFAAAAFGKSGLQMGNFLNQGSAAIQLQQRRYFELSGSQEEIARSAGAADNALREVETAFLGLRNAAAGKLLPALTALATKFADFLAQNREGIAAWAEKAAKAIEKWVSEGGFERLVEWLGEVKNTIGQVIEILGGFKGALLLVAAVMAGPLLASIVSAIPAVYALGVAILTTPVGWILAGVAAIVAAFALLYASSEDVRTSVSYAFAVIKASLEPLEKLFSETFGTEQQDALRTMADLFGVVLAGGVKVFADNVAISFRLLAPLLKMAGFLSGITAGSTVRHLVSGNTSGMASTPTPMQSFDPGASAPMPFSLAQMPAAQAEVLVSFQGAPPGTRVTQARDNTANVSTDVGYSMAGSF